MEGDEEPSALYPLLSLFPQPLPDLVFAQILRGFLISNRKDKTTESVTYQNIYRILHEMNMTTI